MLYCNLGQNTLCSIERVFRRFGLYLARDEISDIVSAKPLIIERFLLILRAKLINYQGTPRRKEVSNSKVTAPCLNSSQSRQYVTDPSRHLQSQALHCGDNQPMKQAVGVEQLSPQRYPQSHHILSPQEHIYHRGRGSSESSDWHLPTGTGAHSGKNTLTEERRKPALQSPYAAVYPASDRAHHLASTECFAKELGSGLTPSTKNFSSEGHRSRGDSLESGGYQQPIRVAACGQGDDLERSERYSSQNDHNRTHGEEKMIQQLQETVTVLELKVQKLEELLSIKDAKLASLQQSMNKPLHGTAPDQLATLKESFRQMSTNQCNGSPDRQSVY